MSGDRSGEAESPRVVSERLAKVADKIHARLKEPGHILGRAGLREDIRYARELLCLIEQIERRGQVRGTDTKEKTR